ncbi:GNAT family N-acetyltransferase [Nocardioides halotolerans]|uniref:GNAT family N-acetyltransferase n=1 Tax=Nocardioides halotolerans TaxID=433660 RepID=UPI00041E64CF|nr:GNAT family N-acetyltransferase [Nocardioides halotolerans]
MPAEGPVRLVVLDRGRELSGVVHEGESWAVAARRTCASLHADPEPVDLSGEVKRFVVDHDTRIAIRAMTRGDLPDVVRWRAAEHVRPWFTDTEPTMEALEAKYGDRIDGMSPTRMWVVEVNGRSVGFVQDYRIGDYPDYAVLGPDPDAIGIDYLIGEPAWVGHGLGARMLWAWMSRACTRFDTARTFCAAPDHRNGASRRILLKAGFVEGVWFDEPQDDGRVTTMVGHTLDVARVIGAGHRPRVIG